MLNDSVCGAVAGSERFKVCINQHSYLIPNICYVALKVRTLYLRLLTCPFPIVDVCRQRQSWSGAETPPQAQSFLSSASLSFVKNSIKCAATRASCSTMTLRQD